MANVAQLNQIAQDAIQQMQRATTEAEKAKYTAIANEAIEAIETARATPSSSGRSMVTQALQTASQTVSPIVKSTSDVLGVKEFARGDSLAADVVGGLVKGASGILSLPYEIPALIASGAESAAQKLGYEADFTPEWLQPGDAYKFLAGEWGEREARSTLGQAVENIGEAAVETLPALAAGPAVYTAAVTAELIRKQAADVIRPASPTTALVLEAIPMAGPEVSAITTTVPGVSATPSLTRASSDAERIKVAQRLRQEQSKELGGVTTGKGEAALQAIEAGEKYGFNLTRGQATGDSVQLVLENTLRNSPEGSIIIDLDVNNAQAVPKFFMKQYGLVETKALRGPELEDALVANYDAFKTARQNKFKAETRAKFNKLEETDATFNMSPILAKIDELRTKYITDETTITADPIAQALTRLEESLTGTKVESLSQMRRKPGGGMERIETKTKIRGDVRNLSPSELQKHLQDIGEMAFTGSHAKFGDVNPGTTRAIGRELGSAMKQIIDDAASSGDIAAGQLKEARDFYNRSLKDMKTWADIPFIKFMDKNIHALNSEDIIATVKQVGDKEIPIVKALLKADRPELIPMIRKSIIEDVIAKNSTPGRTVNEKFLDVQDFMSEMNQLIKENQFFKGRQSFEVIKNMKDFIPSVDRIIKQYGVKGAPPRGDMIRDLANINSDAQGVFFGTAGRYPAQTLASFAEVVRSAMRDPRKLAEAAVSPRIAKVLKKALNKTPMTKEEIKRFDAWATAYRLQLIQDIRAEVSREEE